MDPDIVRKRPDICINKVTDLIVIKLQIMYLRRFIVHVI